jgi:hypothetical protein
MLGGPVPHLTRAARQHHAPTRKQFADPIINRSMVAFQRDSLERLGDPFERLRTAIASSIAFEAGVAVGQEQDGGAEMERLYAALPGRFEEIVNAYIKVSGLQVNKAN